MNDPLDLKKFIRTVNDFPIDGIVFRDITSLIETPEAFIKTCDELTKITKEFRELFVDLFPRRSQSSINIKNIFHSLNIVEKKEV